MHKSIKAPTPWVPGKGLGFDIDPCQKTLISQPYEVRVQIKGPYPWNTKDENIKSFKKKSHVLKQRNFSDLQYTALNKSVVQY